MPAVLSGNTVVCKPSPFTPLSTLRLVELMNEVLPKGVINGVTGKDRLGTAMEAREGNRTSRRPEDLHRPGVGR